MQNSTCGECRFYSATLFLDADLFIDDTAPPNLCERCAHVRKVADRCTFLSFENQNGAFARLDKGYLLGARRVLRPSEHAVYEAAILLGDGTRSPVSQRHLATVADVHLSTVVFALRRLAWIGLLCLVPGSKGTRLLVVRESGSGSHYGLRGSVVRRDCYAAAEKLSILYTVLEILHWGLPGRRSTDQPSVREDPHTSKSTRTRGSAQSVREDPHTHPYGDLREDQYPSPPSKTPKPEPAAIDTKGTEGGISWKYGEWRKRHPAGGWFLWLMDEPKAHERMTDRVRDIFRSARVDGDGHRIGALYDKGQIIEGLKALGARAAHLGHSPDPKTILKYLEAQATELARVDVVMDPLMCACKREERIREWFNANERAA